MKHGRRLIIAIGAMCLAGRDASAQATVQQPVVEQVSVGTVVSVPDRGRMFLGGVGSAGAMRRDYGPIPWGTASGRFTSDSSIDVGEYIHDFESIDAALHAQPVADEFRPRIRSPRAAAAWRVLKQDWRK
jgi:hypothetical protein